MTLVAVLLDDAGSHQAGLRPVYVEYRIHCGGEYEGQTYRYEAVHQAGRRQLPQVRAITEVHVAVDQSRSQDN